jgi:hypothetical protein
MKPIPPLNVAFASSNSTQLRQSNLSDERTGDRSLGNGYAVGVVGFWAAITPR